MQESLIFLLSKKSIGVLVGPIDTILTDYNKINITLRETGEHVTLLDQKFSNRLVKEKYLCNVLLLIVIGFFRDIFSLL